MESVAISDSQTEEELSPQLEIDWPNVIRQIPGYDPYVGAEEFDFDKAAADHVVGFFRDCLTHVIGEKAKGPRGQPLILEPWQQAIVGNLFGWKRKDGARRYRTAFIYVPRKNGKTILCASIGNYILFCDGEPGAEVYAAAKDREQASTVFNMAKRQVEAEEILRQEADCYTRSIALKSLGSFFKVLSARPKHGTNPHAAIIDELHEQKDGLLVEAITTGMGSRKQPLTLYLTTSDFDRVSVCNTEHEFACKVRDNPRLALDYLPVIYQADQKDDWTDRKVWFKANPNLNISVPLSYLESEFAKAREIPSYENTFKRLYLNLRTEQDVRWLPMDKWRACPVVDNADTLLGQKCYGGLDLASSSDVAAFALLFPRPDGRCAVLPFFWIPGAMAQKRDHAGGSAHRPYMTWARQGFVDITDGDRIDFDFIHAKILDLSKKYKIIDIAFDDWNATQITTQLVGDGLKLFSFGQGFKSMTAPCKMLETLVVTGKLDHGNNPILEDMASSVSIKMDPAANIKPAKNASTGKIDGIVATVMALGRFMVAEPPKKSVYTAERGLIRL